MADRYETGGWFISTLAYEYNVAPLLYFDIPEICAFRVVNISARRLLIAFVTPIPANFQVCITINQLAPPVKYPELVYRLHAHRNRFEKIVSAVAVWTKCGGHIKSCDDSKHPYMNAVVVEAT